MLLNISKQCMFRMVSFDRLLIGPSCDSKMKSADHLHGPLVTSYTRWNSPLLRKVASF